MRFFKMPNRVFDYSLSPNALFVYAYLVSRANVLKAVIVSYKAIAQECHIDPKTACKAINELVAKKLIAKEHRYNIIGYAKNKYVINNLHGGWFKVQYCLFKTQIKSTDFMVYCYIKKCMDSKHMEAFPSLSAISQGTHISRSRCAQAVKFLREYTYINRVKRHYKKTNAYRQNRYLHFKISDKNKEARFPKRTSSTKLILKNNYVLINIIGWVIKNVKAALLFCRGSPYFP